MQDLLKPIKTESLKEIFVLKFEELILSGKLSIGQKLPSERELALQLGVSRPIVHEGLVDLAAKGLVTMKPRVGTIVNDYRREGSLVILNSLLNYHNGKLEPELLQSMLDMRHLFEVETARLAAVNRTQDHIVAFQDILKEEESGDIFKPEKTAELDFQLHHLVAIASGNLVYPLLLNSFRQVYMNLATLFFSVEGVVPVVFSFHKTLVEAIEKKDEEIAGFVMKKILQHGEDYLKFFTTKGS